MATQRKSILTATFGEYARLNPALIASYGGEANIERMISTNVRQANAAGFDVDNIAINPEDPADSIKRFEAKLRSQDWDGLLVGWGLRGNQSHTVLFEAAVNVAREVAPQTRMLFGNAPDDMFMTIQRNFPEANVS
ncbi:hypothetical protein LTS16_024038 [Friedmanniomyces endolithicus]|nr:hypothetical protein LTR75_017850 [Friedmanniomyces endolithicus]KAK0772926.1 hypothetical protein LTR59_015481 [Friedmanniomyces endolithicus]KAK0831898.1 hypothetical protein LTR03_015364 [Friedmanniomyces endolithicus]KAK0845893.1 hypothetical protein LTS02_015131 [Friedmanniomyces endolithicus]KAK0869270.1 hypothetical protein LTR87_013781 [Friedmanniomyces endolithicus]